MPFSQVPELFYLPDVLLNRARCPLGTRQDGQLVDDVILPPWATDATDFIAKHRAALESETGPHTVPTLARTRHCSCALFSLWRVHYGFA